MENGRVQNVHAVLHSPALGMARGGESEDSAHKWGHEPDRDSMYITVGWTSPGHVPDCNSRYPSRFTYRVSCQHHLQFVFVLEGAPAFFSVQAAPPAAEEQ
jgi:hypothetical protein